MTGMYIGLSYINAPKNDPIPLCNYRGSYTPSKYRYDWGAVPTQVYIQITALEFSY
jgi:hypothetical protein